MRKTPVKTNWDEMTEETNRKIQGLNNGLVVVWGSVYGILLGVFVIVSLGL